jgi:predicted AlkP superfamily pyrophosphatase or phosphodiesterase
VDLVMIHLIDVDHQAHDWGKDAPQTLAALKTADEQIRRLWEANEQGLQATFVITGDHGFYDYDRTIRINSLFAEQGWLKSGPGGAVGADWQVTAHLAGSQASIYLRHGSESLAPTVLKLLRARAKGLYRVVDRKELDRLGALPGALCALDPVIHRGPGLPGVSFGADAAPGPWITELPHVRGNHGPLPSQSELQTGFIAAGAGVRPQDLGQISILDVAPTLAHELGVPMPGLPGKVLKLH